MEAHLCVRNNTYLIFVRNFQKNEPERRSGLKKEPERRSGAFRSNSNPGPE